MNDHARELRRYASVLGRPTIMLDAADEIERLAAKLEAAEKERDDLRTELNEIRYGVAVAHDTIKALRAKVERMERRLRLILEEPENTMSNSKAMREMLRQARLALEDPK